jgi:hypothetical protein
MTYYADKTKTEAFAEFGARTNNKINEYSAIARDGSIVLECWYQHVKLLPDRRWRYQVDNLSEWINSHGRNLMLKHLRLAADEGRPVRLIIVKLKNNPNADIAHMDASSEPKDITTHHDRIGEVVELTTSKLIIDFRKNDKTIAEE